MTITDLIPGLKGHGRRRASDKVDELRRDLTIALSHMHAAGDEIALLRNDLVDARSKQAEAEMVVVCQQADIDDLRAENNGLREQLAALRVKFGPQLAAEENEAAVTVPPMVRPVDGPEDEATAPLDVRPLWAARDAGLLGPDDTQPIPAP